MGELTVIDRLAEFHRQHPVATVTTSYAADGTYLCVIRWIGHGTVKDHKATSAQATSISLVFAINDAMLEAERHLAPPAGRLMVRGERSFEHAGIR